MSSHVIPSNISTVSALGRGLTALISISVNAEITFHLPLAPLRFVCLTIRTPSTNTDLLVRCIYVWWHETGECPTAHVGSVPATYIMHCPKDIWWSFVG